MTKIGGFSSDAGSVGVGLWPSSNSSSKATASALAHLVETQVHFEEEEIPPLLRQVLHDTPRDLYGSWQAIESRAGGSGERGEVVAGAVGNAALGWPLHRLSLLASVRAASRVTLRLFEGRLEGSRKLGG